MAKTAHNARPKRAPKRTTTHHGRVLTATATATHHVRDVLAATQVVDERQKQTQVRMSDGLKGRIRDYQDRICKATRFKISFSTAVRVLIEKGLEASLSEDR